MPFVLGQIAKDDEETFVQKIFGFLGVAGIPEAEPVQWCFELLVQAMLSCAVLAQTSGHNMLVIVLQDSGDLSVLAV